MSCWTQVRGVFDVVVRGKRTPKLETICKNAPRGSEGTILYFGQLRNNIYTICIRGDLRDFDEFKSNEIYAWLRSVAKHNEVTMGCFVIEVNDKQCTYVFDSKRQKWYEQL